MSLNTNIPKLFVLSMYVAGALMGGSGFNDVVGISKNPGLGGAADDLEAAGEEQIESRSFGSLSLIGLAISGIDMLVETFVWVYLMPIALINIGFPSWFAIPVGLPLVFVNIVGTAGFLRGMRA